MSEELPADQADCWGRVAARYEDEFVSPDWPGVRNPLRPALAELPAKGFATVADLGCGPGDLLPFLAERFRRVLAIDFAAPMLERARQRCAGFDNVTFHQCDLRDLSRLGERIDVAVAVNSLVIPDIDDLEKSLSGIHDLLRPGGKFLGIVPAIDGVHYLTMLLLDRARRTGMPVASSRKNAALHGEHELYDFGFSEFRYRGLVQHFWQPFEVNYRLRRAGFRKVSKQKVPLSWEQCACGGDLKKYAPPWDWLFQAERPREK